MSELKVKWQKVLDFNSMHSEPICRWIDLANGTMFCISAFFTHGFNNQRREGFQVAIERVGSYLFPISSVYKWDYIAEKLYLPESDARAIADWMNVQMGNEAEQQGSYRKGYIAEIEPVIYAGEMPLIPLAPEIIE